MQSDLDALYAHLTGHGSYVQFPTDWESWNILADCYEDMGWGFTPQLRVLLAARKRPYLGLKPDRFIWFDVERYGSIDPESDLLSIHWDAIKLDKPIDVERTDVKVGSTLREAMEAACIALVGLEDIYDS